VTSPSWAADPTSDLKREYTQLEAAIAKASAAQKNLDGGLLNSLIAARLEVLQTNAALVQQRIHAAESGTKITITTSGIAHRLQKRSCRQPLS